MAGRNEGAQRPVKFLPYRTTRAFARVKRIGAASKIKRCLAGGQAPG
ncbi:hypothetical protein GCM10017566_37320 [Amycolatopsis bartoniae]|uniref:Uncharacterized protein n=1 Tax=Amycolatopsis bartoniae TaxID=941986 RepID=A0A8H9IU14_9PSEU|nr:hypothetical protein GCM10017566_37320 [Amycolatopsis bartoniae]